MERAASPRSSCKSDEPMILDCHREHVATTSAHASARPGARDPLHRHASLHAFLRGRELVRTASNTTLRPGVRDFVSGAPEPRARVSDEDAFFQRRASRRLFPGAGRAAEGTRDPRRGGRPPNGLDRGTVSHTSPSCTIATVELIVRGVVAARLRSVRVPASPSREPSASALDNWLRTNDSCFPGLIFECVDARNQPLTSRPPVVSSSFSGCRRRRGHRGRRRGHVRPRGAGGYGGRAGG